MASSPPNECTEADDASSSSSESERVPNWELLQETLGANALEALKDHLSPSTEEPQEATPNAPSVDPVEVPLPKSNTEYGKRSYWEERFAKEEKFEWLVSYSDVAQQIGQFLHPNKRILVVGCGNSSFSADLYDAGFTNICSLDYSKTVIDAMKKRNAAKRPEMEWVVMDMTDMGDIPDSSYDVVIDKAAMDALMTNEGDVWNPDFSVIEQARRMCRHISRILKAGGYHLHISFAQPHFRKKYLLGLHRSKEEDEDAVIPEQSDSYSEEFAWDYRVETIAGDANDGCFHHFLYIMQKQP